MKEYHFTEEQRTELLQNKNIEKVCKSSVFFTADFKIHAIKRHELGDTARIIFKEAKIPDWLNKKDYARYCIKFWRKVYEKNPSSAFKKIKVKKNKTLSEMNLEELMTKVAYLEEENEFLKKLKALESL